MVLLLAAGAGRAAGEPATAVTEPVPPSLTLGEGRWSATLTIESSVSKGNVLGPISVAPDLAYGVTPRLTLALVHSGVAMTGFRGAAGAGICLRGSDHGCPQTYRNVGLEALHSLVTGKWAAALNAGVHLQPVTDPTAVRLKLGLKAKATAGRFSLGFNPSLVFVANERDTQGDSLWLPLSLSIKPTPMLTAGLGTGVKIPNLSKAADSWQVALGVFAQAQIDPHLAAGASFVFGNVVGAEATSPGVEARFAQLWVSYTP